MTYSIVAKDPTTGETGVAVQSHFFSVGSIVPWARAGVGAVATQAMVDVKYGPLGLELMAGGKSSEAALGALLAADPESDQRQVAMVDSKGRVAAHTGRRCIPEAGHAKGKGFSCQGNIMKSDRVWHAMKEAYESNDSLQFAERLVSALEAAESAGGDARGRQSAALLVVSPELKPNPWEGRTIELRVEDHPDPVAELKRLLRHQRAYEWANKGDERLTAKDLGGASRAYTKSFELAPEIDELKFWAGVGLLPSQERDRGLKMIREVFGKDPNWIQVTKGVAKVNPSLIGERDLIELLPGERGKKKRWT
jgi:uncharacterized Ntn-hydrolase superfamily protein